MGAIGPLRNREHRRVRCGPARFVVGISSSIPQTGDRGSSCRSRRRAKRRGAAGKPCADFFPSATSTGSCSGLVLALSVISVLEIYSATLHTKFVGFDSKQMLWIVGGMVAMFAFSLIDYHRLSEHRGLGLRCLPGRAGRGHMRWAQGAGRAALDQARPHALSAVGVGQADPDRRRGPLLCQPRRPQSHLEGHLQGIAMVGVPMLLVLKQPDLGTALTYSPILLAGLFLGGINWRQALDSDRWRPCRDWCGRSAAARC